jgi:hypothetical protein
MESGKNIPGKVQQTIDSLDGLQRATPAPFFFTRVMARLQSEETGGAWERMVYFLSRPAIAVVTLVTIILLNAAAFYLPSSHGSSTSSIAEQNEPSYTDDYVAANNNFYEYENADAGQ